MVVRIKYGKSVKGILNYNENKVKQGKAGIILASGFSTEVENLTFSQKLRRFTKLTDRSAKIKTKAIHISLNFPPDEKVDKALLQNIAADYIERIGFGNQPYIVYRHNDAHHPHIHIVSTPILPNGRSVSLHNLAKLKSEPARKELELRYHLIVAQSRRRLAPYQPKPVELSQAIYGKAETKQTISNIVREVVSTYKYTSLDELNLILKQYNIAAYRGAIGSRQYQTRGLTYCLTDADGHRIGVPIKASSIYSSPTLANLEKYFDKNKIRKIPYKKYVQSKVDFAAMRSTHPEIPIGLLQERNILTRFQRDDKGEATGIYFIDPFNRTIFRADELGHSFDTLFYSKRKSIRHERQPSSPNQNPTPAIGRDDIKMNISIELIKAILDHSPEGPDIDPGLKKKKKRKRRPW